MRPKYPLQKQHLKLRNYKDKSGKEENKLKKKMHKSVSVIG
jgi:hypothetical protein